MSFLAAKNVVLAGIKVHVLLYIAHCLTCLIFKLYCVGT